MYNRILRRSVFDARSMQDIYINRAVKPPTVIAEIVSTLGVMGLTLAVVGLYGLTAYSVSRRTREISESRTSEECEAQARSRKLSSRRGDPAFAVTLFEFCTVTPTTLPIAGMHAASESLFIRNPFQKSRELPLFVL